MTIDSEHTAAGERPRGWRGVACLGLLASLPLFAYWPAWTQGRLLGPGDGAFLHYPLRVAVWESYGRAELPSWNPSTFSGTGLLAAYRPGALYIPALLLLPLPPFVAFQCLILASLSATAILTCLLLRQLGAGQVGAYFGALAFALGPYLVNHLGDSATVIAMPPLLLALIAAEACALRPTAWRSMGLAASVALLLTAGSPEATRAGMGLVAARLVLAHLTQRSRESGSLWSRVWPVAAGVGLAAPQVCPSLLALTSAGRQAVSLAETAPPGLAGAAGLILRYVSHTPAVALAVAAVPLMLRQPAARVLGVVLGACLVLQWGRGPLTAPGALPLVFDLALTLLAGLALSWQWEGRRSSAGARGRGHFFVAALICVSALPISAAAAGPLASRLAPGVGLLTLALVLYFRLASHRMALLAGAWLVPLTLSFVLQPQGRDVWARAPLRPDLSGRSATRDALQGRMGALQDERVLTLARRWPREAVDLAFGNLAVTHHLRSANGYDPMVPSATLQALSGLTSGGLVEAGAFFRTDPRRLNALGIRWVQVPTSALAANSEDSPGRETLDAVLGGPDPRFFALPTTPATAVRVVSSLSNSVGVAQGAKVARVVVHLASGRQLVSSLRAGEETAEWAYERADVQPVMRHARAQIAESWNAGGFAGHRYVGTVPLPGRYLVTAVSFEPVAGAAELLIARLALVDAHARRSVAASVVSAFASDTRFFRPALATPTVRLYEMPGTSGRARVVKRLVLLPDDAAVQRALESPTAHGLDLKAVAVTTAREAAPSLHASAEGRASLAEIREARGGHLALGATGPGVLVVAESWDAGWAARVDGQPRPTLRVNQAQIGVVLTDGPHTIVLDHHPVGFLPGVLVAVATLALLARFLYRSRSTRPPGRS